MEKPVEMFLLHAHAQRYLGESTCMKELTLFFVCCGKNFELPLPRPKRVKDVFDAAGNLVVAEGVESLFAPKKKKPTKEEKAVAKAAAKKEKARLKRIAAGDDSHEEQPELAKVGRRSVNISCRSSLTANPGSGDAPWGEHAPSI
jgi:hypothetical protein